MKRPCFSLLVWVFVAALPWDGAWAAQHVVLVVCDGLRPDLVTAEQTPTIWRLAQEGVFFEKHHPVFVSSTAVNCVALATGAYPHKNGIIGNIDYYPALDALTPLNIDTVGAEKIAARGDAETGGHFVRLPTIAELLHEAGLTTAVSGGKDVALWMDRALERKSAAAKKSFNVFAGHCLAPEMLEQLEHRLGAFPRPTDPPFLAQNVWARRALTEGLWADGLPAFSVFWQSEPDASQHRFGPGAAASLAALKMADENVALLLQKLDELGVREKTDVLVVSDHGFTTVAKPVDLLAGLREAGFRADRKFERERQAGDVLAIAGGGSELPYVAEHDQSAVQRLVDFLQGSPFCGAIFTREKMAGTFALASVKLDREPMPDVVFSYRWNGEANAFRVPGMFFADGGGKGPMGSHGSLSASDMHNTLVANGPDFKRGYRDALPSGNVDVAPTILTLLGQPVPAWMEGRVLGESLRGAKGEPASATPETLRAERILPDGAWRQYLQVSRVGAAVYLDEANGAKERK